MYIGKINRNLYVIKDKQEWSDVETAQIDEKVLTLIVERLNELLEIQDYLEAVYLPLRQTGAADVSNVEVPACLLEVASKRKSTSTSRKKASSSSTKKKATTSGSPKDADATDA